MKLRKRVRQKVWDGTAKTEVYNLPTDSVLDGISVRLSLTATVSGVSTAGTVLDTAVARLMPSIRLMADGRSAIKSYPARMAWNIASMYRGTDPEHTPPADGENGAKAIAISVPLEFSARRAHPSALTRLDTRRFKSLQLEVTFAAPGAGTLFSSDHDGTSAVTNGLLEIYYEQLAGPGAAPGKFILQEQHIPILYAAAVAEHFEELSLGKAYRRIPILTEDDGTTDDPPSNTQLTTLRLIANGTLHIYSGTFLDLRAETKTLFQRESLQTGWAVMDLLQHGSLTTAVNAGALNTLQLQWDAIADSKIHIVPCSLVHYGR